MISYSFRHGPVNPEKRTDNKIKGEKKVELSSDWFPYVISVGVVFSNGRDYNGYSKIRYPLGDWNPFLHIVLPSTINIR